ncbi:hypothetical protein SAMN05421686_1184 [Thalassolituus maritimus]|uniref:Uncharacterized protein n=1 Tax=Thalassolituus maritimus TaxID=484498 RepID=A0A1N7QC21_9GAMM|nr:MULTISPECIES: hypothetical protein [Thalassolituus]SIT20107.1 hypothetical protein SAMN05421686_1184 [Thalassolituus maritimus]
MTKDHDLTLINTTPPSNLPATSLEDFRKWVLSDGLTPSAALRKLMDVYDCPKPDSSLPIRLVELAYPDVDISKCHFTFRITDSGYPNSNPSEFSDSDFDALVEELRNAELGW